MGNPNYLAKNRCLLFGPKLPLGFKVSEVSHENEAWAWTKFKTFFARLTGMKKLIFLYIKFFGSGHFLIHDILKNRPINDWSKKSQNIKKFVSSCLLTMRRNFWNLFILWTFFHDCFLKLWIFISKWADLFSKKLLAQIVIFGKYFGWFNVELNQKTLNDL